MVTMELTDSCCWLLPPSLMSKVLHITSAEKNKFQNFLLNVYHIYTFVKSKKSKSDHHSVREHLYSFFVGTITTTKSIFELLYKLQVFMMLHTCILINQIIHSAVTVTVHFFSVPSSMILTLLLNSFLLNSFLKSKRKEKNSQNFY